MGATAAFRIGDKVVYPNHGVGIIEHISSQPLGDRLQEFYLLRIEASNLRVMVPLGNVAQVGMRAVTLAADTSHVLAYLAGGETPAAASDWKWRFKENSEKMRDGSLLHVAEVLKTLLQLNQNKPLSFREKKMLERAQVLLVDELASAQGLPPLQAAALLRGALAKAHLELPAVEAEA